MKNETESLTLEQLQQQNKKLEQQNTELSAKLKWYEEQFRLAQQKRFGASSEKTHPDQLELNLFNEAEVLATPEGQVPEMEKVTYERRKTTGKREEDLSKLPVETVTNTLEEGEQICTCCSGSLHEMTTETRSEIAVVPPQVKVVRHVRQVYACRHCERHGLQTPIVTAPMPKPVYPGLSAPDIFLLNTESTPHYRLMDHIVVSAYNLLVRIDGSRSAAISIPYAIEPLPVSGAKSSSAMFPSLPPSRPPFRRLARST